MKNYKDFGEEGFEWKVIEDNYDAHISSVCAFYEDTAFHMNGAS